MRGFLRIIVVTEKGSDCLNERLESKKRNRKVLITDRAIKKVPRIEYKEIPEDEYDNIWDLAKQVLEISQKENDSNEVAITYSLDNKRLIEKDEKYIGIAFGDEHEVDPMESTTAYHLIMSSEPCVVIVLHRHPSLSKLSLTDVRFFLEHDSVKMIVAITNLGRASYLVKKETYSYEKAIRIFNDAVTLHNQAKEKQSLKSTQKAADYFLKNCFEAGIVYDDR